MGQRRRNFDRIARLIKLRLVVPLMRSQHPPEYTAWGTAIGLAWAFTPTPGIQMGLVFVTWLQSRFARVNAAVLFIALLFFGWLWGVAGLLLGAPLIAIVKVICDRIESLKPVGELLGS